MVKYHTLETITRRAPLGLRFVDAVSDKDITDGLSVTAWRQGTLYPYYAAQRSPQSGIYGYATLPEYRKFETDEPAPLPDTVNYIVYVHDRLNRFLPQTHIIEIPQPVLKTVELYSHPARPKPAGMAVIRGELWDATNEHAARWAKLEAEIAGKTYKTIADDRGLFVLYMPFVGTFPQPDIDFGGGNPGGGNGNPGGGNGSGNGTSLNDLTWDVTVTVAYHVDDQIFVDGLRDDKPPTMDSINAQQNAELEDSVGGSSEANITRSLHYQQELILKTGGVSESRLRLVPD